MHPVLVDLGFFTVRSYGVFFVLAVVCAVVMSRQMAKRESLPPNHIELVTYAVSIASIIGGRAFYAFVENAGYYFAHPLDVFNAYKGGLSFFGSLAFMILTVVAICRWRGFPVWQVADIYGPTVAIGLGMGKIGCFLSGCCYGRPTDLPWGVTFTQPAGEEVPRGIPLHPVQLYEAAAWIALAFALVWYRGRRRVHGELFLLFLAGFGLGRSALEIFRGEPSQLGPLTLYQWLGLAFGLAGLAGWWLRRKLGGPRPVPAAA